MKLTRRTLLIGGGAGVGLVVAFAAWPRRIGSNLEGRAEDRVFDHFLKIGTDGRVTVAVPQVETGQGVWTALPQIAADELGAAWDMVAVEPGPSSPLYANPLAEEGGWTGGAGGWRAFRLKREGAFRITAGATSIRAWEAPLRRSAATARALLCAAAAERWGVRAAECDTQGGFVTHENKRLGFAALAEAAAELEPPQSPRLRPAGSGTLAGRPLPRLDLPGKTDGSARLAADVRLPGMLFASIRLAPRGGALSGYDRAAGPGLIAGEGWLAAVAPTWWAAERVLARAAPRFSGPADADDAVIERALREAFEHGAAEPLFERGDYAAATQGSRPLAATYSVAPALHLGLEPLSATARLTGDRLEIWAPTLAPELARRAAAEAAGAALAQTTLYPMPVGAGDGPALEADAVPIAALLARRAGRPVQLVYPRGQGRRHDRPRPPAMARMLARPTPDGRIAAWKARIASADGLSAAFARLLGEESGGLSPREWDGAVPPYAIGDVAVEGIAAALPLATGYHRGGAQVATSFFTESFVDELARIAGAEPLAYRIGLLGGQPRLARAIQTAAAIGGWDGGGPGSTMGLSCLSAFGSHIGLLASATIGSSGQVEVERLVAAVDCGRAINPGLVRQQVEGGLLAGLHQATAAAPSFHYGLAVEAPLRVPRLARTPAIEVEVLPSSDASGGISGLADAAVAPAVANAIAAATGRRLRNLPFDPMGA